MDNKKKRSLQTIIILFLAIELIAAHVKIRNLESTVRNLRSDLVHSVSNLEERVNSVYRNVDDFLKQEASLLSGMEYVCGEFNPDTRTVNVDLSVIPKEIHEDMTLYVTFDDTSVELTRNGNTFKGAVPVGLFVEDEQPLLTIKTEKRTQTQYLEDVYIGWLFPQYIPTFYHCDISGEMIFYPTGKYMINGTLNINCSPSEDTPNVHFVRYELITERNGKEIDREDITKDVLNYEAYPNGVYFRDGYEKSYDVVQGDELITYLEAEDSLGYIHRCILHMWKQQNGAVAEARYAGEVIFDREGNILYGKQFG